MTRKVSIFKTRMLLIFLCSFFFLSTHPLALSDWNPGEPYKWYQAPDLTPTGIDICVDNTGDYADPQRTIGDDFECRETGPITDVHFWGSWRNDIKGRITTIHISFYSDDPVGPGGTNPDNQWSTPDLLLWDRWFDESQFTERLYYTMPDGSYEGWWDPRTPNSYTPLGDTEVYQYNIDILNNPFIQEGNPDQPIIYWLVIEVKIDLTIENSSFGWKTRYRWNDIEGGGHFMDDAVWYGAQWVDIEYPLGHEYHPDSVDMSFVITSEQEDGLDFGDAPDSVAAPGYPTYAANGGASHIITPYGPWLGDPLDTPDPEPDGQPDPVALGDDNDGNDDEDGVQIPVLTAGQTATINFLVDSTDGGGGTVSGWIDFNGNKIWGDTAVEQVIAASYPNGPQSVTVSVPSSAVIGQTFARIRISRDPAGQVPTGPAIDGEVEDYEVFIKEESDLQLKFRQLPLNGAVVNDIPYFGHDELSTAYSVYDDTGLLLGFEGCYMADDFADLKHSPIVKIRWWGSYIENELMEPVTRFLIVFEEDIPAIGEPNSADYIPSHPGEVIQSQIVHRSSAIPLNQGEFSETSFSSGGPPCNEALFEYEALLRNPNPFRELKDTVYWLKIVALVDLPPDIWDQIQFILDQTGMTLCEFLNLPYEQQRQYGLERPLTRWGWHNRDYTVRDPLASTPPAVVPGEHDASLLPWTLPIGNPPIEVWHFQDDAVSGEVIIDDQAGTADPFVEQPTWFEEYYKYFLPYCIPTIQGVDGPVGIDTYSKDLAFELWTTDNCRRMLTPAEQIEWDKYIAAGKTPSQMDCWCNRFQCRGDAADDLYLPGVLDWVVYSTDLTLLVNNWKMTYATCTSPCADFDHQSYLPGILDWTVYSGDLSILVTSWKKKPSDLTDCPTYLP